MISLALRWFRDIGASVSLALLHSFSLGRCRQVRAGTGVTRSAGVRAIDPGDGIGTDRAGLGNGLESDAVERTNRREYKGGADASFWE